MADALFEKDVDLLDDYLSDSEDIRRKDTAYISDDDDDDDGDGGGGVNQTGGDLSKQKDAYEQMVEDKVKIKKFIPKVYYCSRTHSQLAQFVREIRKTSFKETRVVSLGSRKSLCINTAVSSLSTEQRINDACLDLQQKSTKKNKTSNELSSKVEEGKGKGKRSRSEMKQKGSCPFLSSESQRSLSDKYLAKVMDIEECVSLAKSDESCAYYGSREAADLAELVVLPYNSLLHKDTRRSLQIDLTGSVVVLDEAHNIIETINSIHGALLRQSQVTMAQKHLNLYLDKYRSRLKGKNILYINQILHVLKALAKFFVKMDKRATKSPPTTTSSSSTTTTPLKTSSNNQKTVFSINDLLFDLGIDNLNLFKLERYLEQSKLSQKLLGFMAQDNDNSSSSSSSSSSSGGGDSATGNGNSNDSGLSSHISHLSIVHRFLMTMTHSNKDGRVVAERIEHTHRAAQQDKGDVPSSSSSCSEGQLKFILLNPSMQFQSLVEEAHAVILLGGTMQPFNYVAQQLLSSPPSILRDANELQHAHHHHHHQQQQYRTFACGHVIPPDNILPLAISKGPNNIEFDFTYKSRQSSKQIDELGCLLSNICVIVPKGIVCFLPSFDYLQFLINYWKKNGTYQRISQKKNIFQEPRLSNEVDGILNAFSRSVNGSVNGGSGGALLLCVVGAKMSEGINFSDDMARCVVMVGLPFPDSSDPELIQKMQYLDQQTTNPNHHSHPHSSSHPHPHKGYGLKSPGQEYYENLCMRAVNQSIGRSIRHIRDYSAVLLVDKRYSTKSSILAKIPKWISEQIKPMQSFGETIKQLRQFYIQQQKKSFVEEVGVE